MPLLANDIADLSPCRQCGACCSYSRDWPRFSLEDDEQINRIPRHFQDEQQRGMRCEMDRCVALIGDVGTVTTCSIYSDRPEICRACEPGDDACQLARERFGLPLIERA